MAILAPRQLFRLAWSVLAFAVAACGDPSPSAPPVPVQVTTGTISGSVADATSSAAIAGASVSTQPASATVTTDAQGAFTIVNVAPGAYTVQATAATYAATGNSPSVTVTAGQTATATVALAPLLYPDLTVANATDVVNGDVMSTRGLFLSPGSDGISLAEAITAVNNTPGPHTITFSDSLVGQVIRLTQFGIHVTRDSVTIIGRFGTDGAPAITVDGTSLRGGKGVVWVTASAFALSRMRIVGVPYLSRAVIVTGGAQEDSSYPQVVSDITIRDNVFDNRGHDYDASGVELRLESEASGARIKNVTITHNAFHHFQGDRTCVQVATDGSNNVAEDVTISNNSFSECTFALELVNGGISSNGQVLGTQIVGNYFADGVGQAISIANLGNVGDVQARNNVIDSTMISGNVIARQTGGPAIAIFGGAVNATEGAVLNTQIINNLLIGIATGSNGIAIAGGLPGGQGSRIEDLRIVNNTTVNFLNGSAIRIENDPGGAGNTVSELLVSNTIMSGNLRDTCCEDSPAEVRYSIMASPPNGWTELIGVNGNIGTDPLFVDSANGDFHLRAGSPAIGAGTNDGAPVTDIECRPRTGKPDIGAFQFGGPAVCALPKPFW